MNSGLRAQIQLYNHMFKINRYKLRSTEYLLARDVDLKRGREIKRVGFGFTIIGIKCCLIGILTVGVFQDLQQHTHNNKTRKL